MVMRFLNLLGFWGIIIAWSTWLFNNFINQIMITMLNLVVYLSIRYCGDMIWGFSQQQGDD